ncbi:glycosyltransferase family 39 protein [Streptomyces iconiensis]|uniref:Glycosyltransferase family 39 protein n=1 Tax=Streptomyces iconiensis TaxID=1384038 RepID=A0ABT6ZP70_9ACTN|nr:glycosyltransferase family 39 protein [Streptomyces iconiensis]MDJ1130662.1 glycosyltransferase family 39 protein [Streptomyces iconiensis]
MATDVASGRPGGGDTEDGGVAGPRGGLRAAPVLVPASVALLLGAWGIQRQGSMWRDEAVTWYAAHLSLPELWHLVGNIDAVHALYYVLMHSVFSVWDGGLVALRLPSVVATAVAAAGVGALGHRLSGARAGLVAGVIFCALPIVQHNAQEGRSYALVSAMVVWATHLLLRAVRSGSPKAWAGYAVLLLLACWMHEFAALAMLAHGVTLKLSAVSPPTWRSWRIACAAIAAGLTPLVVLSLGQAKDQLGWLGRPGAGAWALFAGISLLGWMCSRVSTRSVRRPDVAAVALPLLVVPTGALLVASLVKPWYVDRYVFYGMAGLALLLGVTLDRALGQGALGQRVPYRAARATGAALCCAGLVAALLPLSASMRTPQSRKDDAIAVTEAVRRMSAPGDAVLFMPSRRRVWLLSSPPTYRKLDDLALARAPADSGTLQGEELPARRVEERLRKVRRVIALTDEAGEPLDATGQESVKRRTLNAGFSACETARVKGARIVLYARGGSCPPRR